MPRGFFTQSVNVLFEQRPSLEAVAELLPECERFAKPIASWMGSAEELVVRFNHTRNGALVVDVVDDAWPDGMGDPKLDPDLFGAWSMGAFGPQAFPGNLERALTHAYGIDALADRIRSHRAFVRLRTTYVLGAGTDAPILPEGWDGLAECERLVEASRALLELDRAIVHFDPNGEVLAGAAQLDALRASAREQDVPPIDVFTNVRFFELGDRAGWSLMDTVGMERFLLPDVELAFPRSVDPNEVGSFLRDVQLYFLERGAGLGEGDTIEGPGGGYRALVRERSLVPAPRAVVRLVPEFAVAPGAVLD